MGEQVAGAQAAKDLGIYLGQLYGWVKQGKVKNYKEDGKYVVDGGKGLIVDIDEARAAWMTSKKKTPRDPSKPRATKSRKATIGPDGEVVAAPKTRRLSAGTIVSWENGKQASGKANGPPSYTVAQVLASTGKLTYFDAGDHRRTYDGVLIDNIVFATDRFSNMLAKGVARVEHPVNLLGMVLLAFMVEGKEDLAASLERWLIKNEVPVIVPELMDLEEEDEEEPIRGKPIMFDDDEE